MFVWCKCSSTSFQNRPGRRTGPCPRTFKSGWAASPDGSQRSKLLKSCRRMASGHGSWCTELEKEEPRTSPTFTHQATTTHMCTHTHTVHLDSCVLHTHTHTPTHTCCNMMRVQLYVRLPDYCNTMVVHPKSQHMYAYMCYYAQDSFGIASFASPALANAALAKTVYWSNRQVAKLRFLEYMYM